MAAELSNGLEWYKNDENDRIWWIDNVYERGTLEFSFDKEKIYNLFRDYPQALTPEEKRIFDEENPFWAEFFKSV